MKEGSCIPFDPNVIYPLKTNIADSLPSSPQVSFRRLPVVERMPGGGRRRSSAISIAAAKEQDLKTLQEKIVSLSRKVKENVKVRHCLW